MPDAEPFEAARSNAIGNALLRCAPYFTTAAAFSFALNVLHLAPSLFMMQIYDRVLTSGNGATLVLLALILLLALLSSAILDAARARVLLRCGAKLDRLLAPSLIEKTVSVAGAGDMIGRTPFDEFEGLKQCVAGPPACAVFDLPWVPVHVLILGLMHPALGIFAAVAAALVIGAALLADLATRRSSEEAGRRAHLAKRWLDHALVAAVSVRGVGSEAGAIERALQLRGSAEATRLASGERAAIVSAASRTTRQALQSLVMALGAYLVIEQAASAGIMFAASLLLGKALQPLEQLASAWRPLQCARRSYIGLGRLLAPGPRKMRVRTLLSRSERIVCQGIGYLPPAATDPVVRNVNLDIAKGSVAVILGPTGCGKSTLLKLLAGALPPSAGRIEMPAAMIGYLPQSPALLSGTIGDNIAGFGNVDEDALRAATARTGAEAMIARLPGGYRHPADDPAVAWGLQQRIAIARALYRDPQIVLMDEPCRDLDAAGETDIARLLGELRAGGRTAIIVSHRPAILALADTVVLMQSGTVVAAGPRADVLARAGHPASAVVPGQRRVVAWRG